MSLHWFSSAVTVSTSQAGVRFQVSNTEAATAELMKWTKRGPHWNRAVRVCMASLADQATPQEVRRCFRLAAKEEGVLLPE
ncbi:DUF982 domain-containing protein [Mesorhizobium sp. ES1-3]|uniref:DUF982 domain-containing protein n=1 Tax=Mesorhizobium sp. ES1-3 TaxID=2876628 RepID=UPI001CCEB30D|nr:DUF982 domain-containing protein [Mesorhizobium sp. ES1-3]MBZ9669059.1 DUF982 domain-containing protein [Mesorhizobium sp. ES1-3]